MRGRFRSVISAFDFISLPFLFVLSVSLFESTFASSSQADYFLQSVRSSLYNFEFLVEGLNSIDSIKFRSDSTTGYREFLNEIDLTHTAENEDGGLKALLDLSSEDLGDIAHESFHAFRANLVRYDSRYEDIEIWMRRRAQIVFPSLSLKQGQWALEEAYGVFIGTMVAARLQIEKMLKKNSENCQATEKLTQQYWRIQWNSKISGYVRNTGFLDYWSHVFEGGWLLLNEGNQAYHAFKNRDPDHYQDDVILPERDKNWIALRLLEGIFPSFQKTFQNEPAFLACRR